MKILKTAKLKDFYVHEVAIQVNVYTKNSYQTRNFHCTVTLVKGRVQCFSQQVVMNK